MTDRLSLHNMIFYGYHGAFGAENELGQKFEVDVDLCTDLRRAGQTDDVDLACDYVDIYTVVKDIVEERQFNLIEGLAEAIAQQILAMHDLEQVRVRVRKPHVPIGGLLDCVEVEIIRPVPA